MHIGIVGPCSSGPLAEFLPEYGGLDLGWGGYSVVNIVRALLQRGHRISVITLSPDISETRILRGPALTYYVYPTRLKHRMRDLFKLERQGLREGILLAKPELLHAHWTYEFALACFETSLPTLVTCRDNAFEILRYSKDLYRLGRLYMQLRVMRRARFLTAVSPYLAASLRWLAKTEIEVIPNSIPLLDREHMVNSYQGASEGPVKIATVLNGWGNRKNPKAALRAFDLLRRELPNAEMFMYGYDFEKGGVASTWAAENNLSRNIHFCGPLPNQVLLKELTRMSILLHPALEESFGMVIGEAIALGLPVVAGADAGAVSWVLDGGRAGFLTDVRKPAKIAETLLACVERAEERDLKRRNAYDRLLKFFSPDSVAGQYENSYQRVLASC